MLLLDDFLNYGSREMIIAIDEMMYRLYFVVLNCQFLDVLAMSF